MQQLITRSSDLAGILVDDAELMCIMIHLGEVDNELA